MTGVNIIDPGTYVLQATHASGFAPADATTYYFGSRPAIGPLTSSNPVRILFPKAGTVTRILLAYTYDGGASTETSAIAFFLNDTTATNIAASFNASTTQDIDSGALSIAVVRGDYFAIRWITPTWTTNPTGVKMHAVVYVEP